jgi:hypothetical protein
MRDEYEALVARANRPCEHDDALDAWLEMYLGLRVPRRAVCRCHTASFEYLRTAYFEPATDQVVWAPRGGGKTRLGAVATLLDLLHKPGIQVRILGGSMEQSLKMWEHLLPDIERIGATHLTRELRGKVIVLKNRSRAGVVAQSQRAVRGMRIQKLRCDEVELFEPEVWEAAQLTVQSAVVTGPERDNTKPQKTDVRGVVEALSTFHKPWGLMAKIVDEARAAQRGAAHQPKRIGFRRIKLVQWCILDVLEKCPPERECASCPLWDECGGMAKEKCDGFYKIDDAIAAKYRVSEDSWNSEMLCRRPSQKGRVFPAFRREKHVCDAVPGAAAAAGGTIEMSWAIDFGFRAPFVCLWVATHGDGRAHVIDEYVREERTVAEHLLELESRPHGRPAWVACDPAGSARNEQTAESNVALLTKRGYRVRKRPTKIVEGVERIRHALKPAAGEPTLFVHPRCARLIRALEAYHYARDGRGGELPDKDGEHDHLIDALRYHFVNRGRGEAYGGRAY